MTLKVLLLAFFILLISSCQNKEKKFSGGIPVKVESFEDWDKRTKNNELRNRLDSIGVDTREIKKRNLNPLKGQKRMIHAKITRRTNGLF